MKYLLIKNKEVVGEAIVFAGTVTYHLWSSIRTTRRGNLVDLKKKYKFEKAE